MYIFYAFITLAKCIIYASTLKYHFYNSSLSSAYSITMMLMSLCLSCYFCIRLSMIIIFSIFVWLLGWLSLHFFESYSTKWFYQFCIFLRTYLWWISPVTGLSVPLVISSYIAEKIFSKEGLGPLIHIHNIKYQLKWCD